LVTLKFAICVPPPVTVTGVLAVRSVSCAQSSSLSSKYSCVKSVSTSVNSARRLKNSLSPASGSTTMR
jgi:hypothetical protein